MDGVHSVPRTSFGTSPAVTAASRVRRRNREDEELEEQGRNDGHPAEEETDDEGDDGLPHVDVLA
jgi:hypothetical protein